MRGAGPNASRYQRAEETVMQWRIEGLGKDKHGRFVACPVDRPGVADTLNTADEVTEVAA